METQAVIKLLVVDDDPGILDALRRTFRKRFQVSTTDQGPEGLRRLREEHPDVVLVDYLMPGMDGVEFLHKLRNTGDRTPVILMSAMNIAPKAEGLDISAVIEKPFDLEELESLVTRTAGAEG